MVQSLYDKDGIKVTSSELQVGDKHYPIQNIRSVTLLKATPPRIGPAACIVAGFLCFPIYGVGVIGIIGGVVWLLAQSSKHLIVLNVQENSSRSSDSVEAYRSADVSEVKAIQLALDKARAEYS